MVWGAIANPRTLGGVPVTSIGYDAFSGCSGLTSVTIPDSVKVIRDRVFDGCTSLYDTNTIPGVFLVDGWAFGHAKSIPERLDLTGVRGIGNKAFAGCTGLDVTVPATVTNIGQCAFSGCKSVTYKHSSGIGR